MLIAAFEILGVAVLLGSVLAVLHLRGADAPAPPWPVGILHGAIALGGFVVLILALQGPPRGLDTGTSSFGTVSAVLCALAALMGGWLFTKRVRRKWISSAAVGVHASLAIGGFVILAAYVLLGS